MGKKRHTVESIVAMLREAEVQMAKGQTLAEVVRQLGISDATYYKWRKEYGGLHVDQAKRYKELEQENQRLRKVIADLTLDNSILKEAAFGREVDRSILAAPFNGPLPDHKIRPPWGRISRLAEAAVLPSPRKDDRNGRSLCRLVSRPRPYQFRVHRGSSGAWT